MSSDKVWEILTDKAHVLLAALCQTVVLIMHWHTGRDLGPNVQNTIFSFYAFLAGHFSASQVWPDKTTPSS